MLTKHCGTRLILFRVSQYWLIWNVAFTYTLGYCTADQMFKMVSCFFSKFDAILVPMVFQLLEDSREPEGHPIWKGHSSSIPPYLGSIFIYIYVYAYIHLRICVKIYLYINNGGSKSPPQLWGGMCGNSDLYTAETVPFPSLKPTGSPLKTGRDPKESSSNHPFSGVTPTRLKAFLMNTWAENELHFSNWNFKKKIWRQHNFCWMIWNIWSICKMLSRILILSRANNKSWFMSGQRCWFALSSVVFFQQSVHGVMIGWQISSHVSYTKIYPLNHTEPTEVTEVWRWVKNRVFQGVRHKGQGWILRMGFMMIHVQLLIACTLCRSLFCLGAQKPWNLIVENLGPTWTCFFFFGGESIIRSPNTSQITNGPIPIPLNSFAKWHAGTPNLFFDYSRVSCRSFVENIMLFRCV